MVEVANLVHHTIGSSPILDHELIVAKNRRPRMLSRNRRADRQPDRPRTVAPDPDQNSASGGGKLNRRREPGHQLGRADW
jgi:hypothetical protein